MCILLVRVTQNKGHEKVMQAVHVQSPGFGRAVNPPEGYFEHLQVTRLHREQ